MFQERMSTMPMPIIIKEEVDSDSDEVHCRLCHKAFASTTALGNHARMDHVEAYENGDPTVWTKADDDPVVKSKSTSSRKDQKIIIQKRKQEILSSMIPTSLTSLASSNVSYIIVKADDPVLQARGRTVVKKEPKKIVAPKKLKPQQTISGPFECLEPSPLGADGVCHQIFFSCCEYSLHARSEHARRRRAPRCQVCERTLPSRPEDPTRPYACESCGEGFETSDDLQEHCRTLHVKQKPYECSICHKRFTQQGGVLQHMRMHTGDRPYPCTFCTKAFTQKSGLEQHLRTHTKVKPYRCIVCAKAFIQSVHLKQHMRTHTNVAPFQCGICDKRFKQSSHLNYHLKNHNPAYMTQTQRDRYHELVGQMQRITADMQLEVLQVEGKEVEVEMMAQEEMAEEEMEEEEMTEEDMAEEEMDAVEQEIDAAEQEIAEQSIQEEETYIIGDAYEEMRQHFNNSTS